MINMVTDEYLSVLKKMYILDIYIFCIEMTTDEETRTKLETVREHHLTELIDFEMVLMVLQKVQNV